MNPEQYLESVALSLGEMRESVVFVGGMVRSLLVTDPAVPSVRPTYDVDVILEVHSRAEWAELEPRLRGAGFKPDMRSTEIRVIDAVHFVATKLEAFSGRGGGDYYHHDLEDVLVILDGRNEFFDELNMAPAPVRDFVIQRISEFYEDPEFHTCLPGHLPRDAGSQARLPQLQERLKDLTEFSASPPP